MIGLWMGIWALVVLTREEVHEAFVKVTEQKKATGETDAGSKELVVLAAVASFILLGTLMGASGSRHFPWFVFLFGPPVVILDIFALRQWRGQTASDLKSLWDIYAPEGTRRRAIESCALGLLCVIFHSFF